MQILQILKNIRTRKAPKTSTIPRKRKTREIYLPQLECLTLEKIEYRFSLMVTPDELNIRMIEYFIERIIHSDEVSYSVAVADLHFVRYA